jgi:Holliday junction resolvase
MNVGFLFERNVLEVLAAHSSASMRAHGSGQRRLVAAVSGEGGGVWRWPR